MSEMIIPQVTTRRKVFGLLTTVLIAVLLIGGVLFLGKDPHIPLLMAAVIGCVLAFIDGTKWEQLEAAIIRSIAIAMQAIIILLIIGTLIAAWLMGGVIQSLIYYGLEVMNPKLFLVCALLLCSIVSLATGTSWGTAGTIGIVLMAIAGALQIPLPIAAGAIVSGCYFGDKMSPLSDTTNLAVAVTGANLFDHIKSMTYTTVPTYIICLIVYSVIGLTVVKSNGASLDDITKLQEILSASYNINLFALIPPCMVLLIIVVKMPAIPGLFLCMFLGIVAAYLFQGYNLFSSASLGETVSVIQNGYSFDGSTLKVSPEQLSAVHDFYAQAALVNDGVWYPEMNYFTGPMTDNVSSLSSLYNTAFTDKLPFTPDTLMQTKNLLSRGGLDSMMGTISLILIAMILGGVLEGSGFLGSLVAMLLPFTHKAWSITLVSILTGIAVNALASDQYVAVILPGQMYRERFKELNLAPRTQSRIVETGGALTSSLVPWNTCGATMTSFLGVNSFAYAPFAFFNTISLVVELIASALGYKIFKRDEDIKNGLVKEETTV